MFVAHTIAGFKGWIIDIKVPYGVAKTVDECNPAVNRRHLDLLHCICLKCKNVGNSVDATWIFFVAFA